MNLTDTIQHLFTRRVLFISGKGGVGKTTVSALLGIAAAKNGKRALIVEMNSTDRMAPVFGAPQIGHKEVQLQENLWAINLSPQKCFEEYALRLIRFSAIYKAFFENEYVTNFLRAAPGLKEFLMLRKIDMLEKEQRYKSFSVSRYPKYDLIIVDAPATGHGLSALEVPGVLAAVTRVGPLYVNARSIMDLLADHEKTIFCLVTLAEEMPVAESQEYVNDIRKRTDLSFGPMFVNSVMPRPERMKVDFPDTLPAEMEPFRGYHNLSRERFYLNKEYVREIEQRFPDFIKFIIPFQFHGLSKKEHIASLIPVLEE